MVFSLARRHTHPFNTGMHIAPRQPAHASRLLLNLLLGAIMLSPTLGPAQRGTASAAPPIDPVLLDYFQEPGCPDCRRIDQHTIPAIRSTYDGLITLRKWDIRQKPHILRLMAYQDALSITDDHPVLIVVDYTTVLNGVTAIETGLAAAIEAAIENRFDDDFAPPRPIPVPDLDAGLQLAEQRLQAFALPAILLAGLIDGLNPCAMAALAFLMSLLAVSKIRGYRVLWLGIPYCLGAYLTYFAIGLGLMQAFDLFYGVPLLRRTIHIIILVGLILAAFLSFRDAWRFRQHGDPDSITLRLPRRLLLLMHAIMRRGVHSRTLTIGGFLTGIIVTALDAICTGQLYLPTLSLMVQAAGGHASRKALGYLLAYNTMFILPLITVFLLMWLGMHNQKLLDWTRRHVVTGKILIGLLMLILAAIILLLSP